MLPTLKRTITKSTLYLVEGTAYLCALRRHIAPGAHATSTHADEATGVGWVYVKFIDVRDTGWAEGTHWMLIHRVVYYHDCTEQGQPDNASTQLDLCAAA